MSLSYAQHMSRCGPACASADGREVKCVGRSTHFLIALHPPSVDGYISRKLRDHGTYEPRGFTSLLHELPPRSLVVDVGANIGATALLASAMGLRVLAFEPVPANAALLEHSARANCGFNLTVHRVGLADRPRRATIAIAGSSPGASTLGNASQLPSDFKFATAGPSGAGLALAIDLETGDRLVTPTVRALRGEWALKIDVEGYELHALRGMRELLGSDVRPPKWIALEFFPTMLRAAATEPVDVLRWLWARGFDCGVGLPGEHWEGFRRYVGGIKPTHHDDLSGQSSATVAESFGYIQQHFIV